MLGDKNLVILHNHRVSLDETNNYYYEWINDQRASERSAIRLESNPTLGPYMHFHECIEILYCLDGTMTVTKSDGAYRLSKGQFACLNSLTIHNCTAEAGNIRYVVQIPRSMTTGSESQLTDRSFDRFIQDDDGCMLKMIEALYAVRNRTGALFSSLPDDCAASTEKHLCQALMSAAAAVCGTKKSDISSLMMIKIIKYIHEHYRGGFSVAAMSREMNVSQNRLSGEFSRAFGMTVKEYVNRARAEYAESYMRDHGDATLFEVAEVSGFGSERNLIRIWKKEFGCTPREYFASSEKRADRTA